MEFIYSVNLIFMFVVSILFFFSGICLNSLVIVSFWRSVQLRKKLCYFTVMVLSCCDMLVVLTNHPLTGLVAMLWLTEKLGIYPHWMFISLKLSSIFIGFSLLALLVMNFDRYLATYYPIFHRTSVTKAKLSTFLVILMIVEIVLVLMSVNDYVISYLDAVLAFFIFYFLSMLFINYKLFVIAKKSRNRISPEMKKSFSFKSVSSCLLVVACVVVLSIPTFIYTGQRITAKEKEYSLDSVYLAGVWAQTICSMNSTFNCLI